MLSNKASISVAVITLNEADRLPDLLKSIDFADEVVVVDSGSTDDTVRIAEAAEANVLFREFTNFAEQKQFAMKACKGTWILNLDADEEVGPELADEIRSTVDNVSSETAGFSMPRLSRYLNRWIKHGGWYPDRKVRLIRKGKAEWTGDGLHEKLVVDGQIGKLKKPLFHFVYRDIADQIATVNKFSRIHAEDAKAKSSLHLFTGALHAGVKFFECYIYKLGFLDGAAGFVIAMNSAWYVFLKHAKTWELNHKN